MVLPFPNLGIPETNRSVDPQNSCLFPCNDMYKAFVYYIQLKHLDKIIDSIHNLDARRNLMCEM